jgi:catecholate siderophore receptor
MAALAALLAARAPGAPVPSASSPEAPAEAPIAADAGPDGATRVKSSVSVSAPPEGYAVPETATATKTDTPLLDVPQSVTVVARPLIRDQRMTTMADVVRYVPGIQVHQGENNRDQIILRGNSSSADFFVDGVRDDVQYYRDLYNLDRVEALKGPNAMIFGRGGGGGVVNRVTKQAGFTALREMDLQAGSYGDFRAAADVDQPFGTTGAFRVNGVYESAGSFRDHVNLRRYGVAPSVALLPGESTLVTLNYENFHDTRVADRGITSYLGRPADVPVSTYYGNPDDSTVRAAVNLVSLAVEHHTGALTLRNRTLLGDYDRGYQNYVPGAVSADKSLVTLTAYNNATKRRNLFNQTDATTSATTGSFRHTLLLGAEVGNQLTDNFRNTGYFGGTATSITVPYLAPQTATPVTWRQSATDADNHLKTIVAAAYAQDQVDLSSALQLLAGLRFDRFDLTYRNNRTGETLGRTDELLSPRLGLVYKPVAQASVYASYGVSYLPSSGDQFSSLTSVTQQLEPEKFTNYEVGAKWEPNPALAVTAAVYRLDRTNTRATDPNDPTRILQTGTQRTNGVEIGASGRITDLWSVAGGYAYQDARVTSATAAAPEGAIVAQVPRHTFSLWNQVQLHPRVGAAVGVVARTAMYAAIDDTVTLPGYARLDAAVFVTLWRDVRLQVNVENLLDRTYYANADSNTNISPGSPRAFRAALVARF